MSHKTQRPVLLFVAFVLTLFALSQAKADTYEPFQFTDHSGASPVRGIDDAGDVLSNLLPGPCGTTATVCYSVFQPFGPGYITSSLPFFGYDDGTSCSPNPEAGFGVCNNGYEAYWINFTNPDGGVYGGPYTDVQKFPVDLADRGFLLINSFGDIAWTDGQIEENYLAYDLTSHETPEPATIALLLTGLIPIAIIGRRKLIRA
jgi:hypothetical protein